MSAVFIFLKKEESKRVPVNKRGYSGLLLYSVTGAFVRSEYRPAGDANNDNVVDFTDFSILVNTFNDNYGGPNTAYNPAADFNFDGSTGPLDVFLLRNNYARAGDP